LEAKKHAIHEAFDAIAKGADEFKYRSRKNKSESLIIRSSCVSTRKNTVFPTTFGSFNLKGRKLFKSDQGMGTKLVRKHNRYYIHIVKLKHQGIDFDTFTGRKNVCALDPGTGTFHTYYSEDSCGKIAPEAGNVVFRRCLNIDKLISKSSKMTGRKRSNIRRAIRNARRKLSNKIDDLHWKTASFLCKSFHNIFLPHFNTKIMANRAKRKISSKTARAMLTLSHHKFSQRLKSKAEEKGVSLLMVDEPYTSQICGFCFHRNEKLKLSQRVYKCQMCLVEMDRDVNGARNILLRSLGLLEYKDLSSCTMGGTPFGFFDIPNVTSCN
jgi:putative transposase